MRLVELEIKNIRGIRDLVIKPDGKTTVICGPNGTGKSAVIDSLDFLLTGSISRLTGPGTGGITLATHGKHIDCKPMEALVRALVVFKDTDEPVELVRRMSKPNKLEYGEDVAARVEPVVHLARRRQHVLTRREILKYVTADASTRAREVEDLLDLGDVAAIRKSLSRAVNTFKKELKSVQGAMDSAESAAARTLDLEGFGEDAALDHVNTLRHMLGGAPIEELVESDVRSGVEPPSLEGVPLDLSALETTIDDFEATVDARSAGILVDKGSQLHRITSAIRDDPGFTHLLSHHRLTAAGAELVDESGRCPLCETDFAPGKLVSLLERRLAEAKEAEQRRLELVGVANDVAGELDKLADAAEAVCRELVRNDDGADVGALDTWVAALRARAGEARSAPRDLTFDADPSVAPTHEVPEAVAALMEAAVSGPAASVRRPSRTPVQSAWDTLTRLGENLKRLEAARVTATNAKAALDAASAVLKAFEEARDSVMGGLYDEVRQRFVALYRSMNSDDESGFSALLEPEGPSLAFQVDFHERGLHPPQALHSEGHQDSMGLCLYLALAEHLTKDVIDLVLLDDVVMSVDVDHRRQFCRMMNEAFPGRQFIITTHDRAWANQLKTEGVVSSRGILEFGHWDIQRGPRVTQMRDFWERIDECLEKDEVDQAAWRLRRGLEEYFAGTCESLRASVKYRQDGRHALEDLLGPAQGRLSELLKMAKKTANSWGKIDDMDRLSELSKQMSETYKRTAAERWSVNSAVHYNNWVNFSVNDFRPVVDAFRQLCGLFECSGCATPLRVTYQETAESAVRCGCGERNWNLMAKRKG